jgi:hypothetical protein
MRSILALSSAAVVTILLATSAGGRIAAAGPDDCSISGMSGSYACPLSSWTNPSTPKQQQAASPTASPKDCTAYPDPSSSHVRWVIDCPSISQVPGTAAEATH